ncbi:hypothetical protein OSB04_018686 [Centaurea solstitialis]|uniref:Uncharacterized protein n=1 Tax=Centaurea solstitialis TaxID=347529 RepID=A0AA38TII9_9ASTR|nr:hypothetical protein OSB04_018686 [Centaurea solstitialis]
MVRSSIVQLYGPVIAWKKAPYINFFTHCVKKFAQITYKCLLWNPKDRPTMTEVVAQLELLLALTLQNNSRVTFAEKARSLFTIKFPGAEVFAPPPVSDTPFLSS